MIRNPCVRKLIRHVIIITFTYCWIEVGIFADLISNCAICNFSCNFVRFIYALFYLVPFLVSKSHFELNWPELGIRITGIIIVLYSMPDFTDEAFKSVVHFWSNVNSYWTRNTKNFTTINISISACALKCLMELS